MPDDRPQFVQRHTGKHSEQWFSLILIDESLHLENACAAFQADEDRRDFLRGEIELTHIFSRDGQAGHRRAALPVKMNRLDSLQTDMYATIHRQAGSFENAAHLERFVRMLSQPDVLSPMVEHYTVPQVITQLLGNIRADHRIKNIRKGLPAAKAQ